MVWYNMVKYGKSITVIGYCYSHNVCILYKYIYIVKYGYYYPITLMHPHWGEGCKSLRIH